MFRALETFETLVDDTLGSACTYALILGTFFLLVKSSALLIWLDAVNGLLGAIAPNLNAETELSIIQYSREPLGFSEILMIYVTLIALFLVCTILLSHLLIIIHLNRFGPEAFRTLPDFRQTATVVLNSTASLFMPGALPGVGIILGFVWFSITVDKGIAAHYGKNRSKNRRRGFPFSYYYPAFDWQGEGFIMILWIAVWWFGTMAYRLLVFS